MKTFKMLFYLILKLIELPELKTLLRDIFGKDKLSDKMLEKTFKAIDVDQSGTIDFFEVLTVGASNND
jgi:Ca2+-binding EF-hand superfamily protein